MTFLETTESFPWSTVSQMLYRNEKLIGLGPYTHSSHTALIQLMESLTTLMTTLFFL